MNGMKKTFFIFLIIILCFPAVQKVFNPFSSGSLDGFSAPVGRPEVSFFNIFNGKFRDEGNVYSEYAAPFRSDLVRLHNQVDFSLFGVPHAHKIIVGKENYLFEEAYLKAYRGEDFIGRKKIEARVGQFKELQDLLRDSLKVFMLVAFAPDKGSFYPEYIPDRYLRKKKDTTNYQWYKQKLEEAGVHFIDFNQWFLRMKDTSEFVLYPKTGIHWSSYGAFLAMDSLWRYLNVRIGNSLPKPVLGGIEISANARFKDADICKALNLIWEIPHPGMAYPKVRFNPPDSSPKPSALFIGDSFYFCWSDADYIRNSFKKEEFWYYDQDVYFNGVRQKLTAKEMDLAKSLSGINILVFLQTNAGYGNVGYGFVDRALDLLNEKAKGRK